MSLQAGAVVRRALLLFFSYFVANGPKHEPKTVKTNDRVKR